jgi:hypothetical protein
MEIRILWVDTTMNHDVPYLYNMLPFQHFGVNVTLEFM